MKKLISLILVAVMLLSVMPMAYAEETKYAVGDIIQFGSYPQSKVRDEALIAELNVLAPEWDEWTSYNYHHIGISASGYNYIEQGDQTRYTDVIYSGEKYRGVRFTQYRAPGLGINFNYTFFEHQDDNGYRVNTTYWFKYEPIDWRVLDPEGGLVLCEKAIDSQPFSDSLYNSYFKDSSATAYTHEYEFSSIREWLNEDFYNTAFNESEKEEIKITTNKNRGYYTTMGVPGYEKFDGKDTQNKIFLMSLGGVANSKYGFDNNLRENNAARRAKGTAYAKCQGLYISDDPTWSGNTTWLLRSAGGDKGQICTVLYSGSELRYGATSTCFGIRPAFKFKDINNFNHDHDYKAEKTPATCTTDGYTTFTCECGDSYTGEIVEATGHSYKTDIVHPTCKAAGYTIYTCECGDNYIDDLKDIVMHKDDDGDFKCDYGCGLFLGEEGMEASDPCDCKCHKGGIAGFFFKILLFFQKLFGKNKVCACGVAH